MMTLIPAVRSVSQFWYVISMNCKTLSNSNTDVHEGIYSAYNFERKVSVLHLKGTSNLEWCTVAFSQTYVWLSAAFLLHFRKAD